MPVTIERLSPETVAQISAVRERRLRRGSLRDRGKRIEIGLVNNMPDAAMLATERQFSNLLTAASRARRRAAASVRAARRPPFRRGARRAQANLSGRERAWPHAAGRADRDGRGAACARACAGALLDRSYGACRLGRFQYGLDDSFVSGGACRRAASRRNRAPALAGQMLGDIRLRDGAAQQTWFRAWARRCWRRIRAATD